MLVNVGSSLVTYTPAYQGSTLLPVGTNVTATAATGPIMLTPSAADEFVSGFVTSGTVTVTGSTGEIGAVETLGNTATATVGAAGASITAMQDSAVTLTVTSVTPVVPVVSSSPGALGAAAPAVEAPGLAGTAGIQPQLNVELLGQWAGGLSGADLAADLAGAAG